jgi:mandelate racemase
MRSAIVHKREHLEMNAPVTRAHPVLTMRGVRTTPVLVPMTYALGTSAARLTQAPLLLIDLETEEGITGRTYLFGYSPAGARVIALLIEDAAALITGKPVCPTDIAAMLARRFALIGVTGTVRMALSGLDATMWDALAMAAGLPLASLLGSAPRPIRAYNSCGLGLMAPQEVANEAMRLTERGFKAVKRRAHTRDNARPKSTSFLKPA